LVLFSAAFGFGGSHFASSGYLARRGWIRWGDPFEVARFSLEIPVSIGLEVMTVRTQSGQVVEFGWAAVFEGHLVVNFESFGVPAAGPHALSVPDQEGHLEPLRDGAGGPGHAFDVLAVFDDELEAGVT
jgi:hypothetical protein